MGDSDYHNDSMSSNAQLLNQFMACQSSESAKSFAMRLSASPFHPKNQEKLVHESAPETKVLDDAIKTLKDKEDFLKNVILVIDALSDEQKAQVL